MFEQALKDRIVPLDAKAGAFYRDQNTRRSTQMVDALKHKPEADGQAVHVL